MSEFRREERYIVIKLKDLKYESAGHLLSRFLKKCKIPTRECVVVESDWPEYETVWKMIEDRVTGRRAAVPDVDKIMAQAQVFASSWSLVGGQFDDGSMLETAEQEKEALRQMLTAAAPARPGANGDPCS